MIHCYIRLSGMKRCGNHAVIQWLLSQMRGTVCFRNNVRNHRALGDRGCDPIEALRGMDQHEQSQQPPVEVDAAGRMTKVPLAPGNWTNVSNVVKWDAWNRIVEVQFSASVTGAYAYDALHRRRPPLCFDRVCVRMSGRGPIEIDRSGNGLGHSSML